MPAIVQHLTDGAFSTGKAITVAATGAGNLLAAVITTDNLTTDTVTSITDGTSNFAQVPSARATNSSGQTSDVWWLASSNGGKTAITIAFNATTAWACEIYEVSGLTSPVVDVKGAVSSQSMVGTTCNGPSVTPTSPQFGVAGVSCNNSSIAVGGNSGGSPNAFNSGGDISSTENGAACSLITTAAGSEQPIWTASAGSNTFCASCVFFANGSAPSGGGWVGSGSRRAPGQRGPFDQRGFILSPYQQYSYVASTVTLAAINGDSAVTLSLTETADGSVLVQGAASSTFALTETAAGSVLVQGVSTSTLVLTESATASAIVGGAGLATLTLTETASGVVLVTANGVETLTLTESGAGVVFIQGAASQTLSLVPTLDGGVLVQGDAIASLLLSETADGTTQPVITADGDQVLPAITGSADGIVEDVVLSIGRVGWAQQFGTQMPPRRRQEQKQKQAKPAAVTIAGRGYAHLTLMAGGSGELATGARAHAALSIGSSGVGDVWPQPQDTEDMLAFLLIA